MLFYECIVSCRCVFVYCFLNMYEKYMLKHLLLSWLLLLCLHAFVLIVIFNSQSLRPWRGSGVGRNRRNAEHEFESQLLIANHAGKTMHELRNNTMFAAFVSYAVSYLSLYVFSEMFQKNHYKMTFVMFVQIHQAHYKIIAILHCISIFNMLRVLMCICSRSQNEASKYAGKRKPSTLHQCRAFRPSCPTGSGPCFSFVL